WPRHCLPSARELVRSVILSSTTPLSTKDVYKLTMKQPISDQLPEYNVPKIEYPTSVRGFTKQPSMRPPHPEHPVRSLQYLKRVVLLDLVDSKDVEKFCTKNTWLWRTATPPPPPKPKPSPSLSKSELLGLPRLTAADVGVGEDWSHLNKRRQRARKEKVEHDLKWMWMLQAAKREAAREAL
ncbi:hypothetical protein DFH29DRAFT_771276, partial [Suillus ampliporus]